MKKISILLVTAIIFCGFSEKSKRNLTSSESMLLNTFQNSAIRFSEGGVNFSVYLDGSFDYQSSGERVSYNYSGKVSRIGDVFINYNYDGSRVSQIGNVYISYDFQGKKVSKIGCLYVQYDYQGRFTGTSGSVGCGY